MNRRNNNDNGPTLLIARVSRDQRWTYLALAAIGLASSLALLGLGAMLFEIEIVAVPSLLCGTLLLIGILILLDRPFIRGDIYSSVIANSRTIAVKYRRGRIRMLKRRECVACNEDGTVLFDSGGRRYPIVVRGPVGYDHAEEFRALLFAWWWPGTTMDTVRQHAFANGCGVSTTMLAILLGNAPFFLAIYACLFHDICFEHPSDRRRNLRSGAPGTAFPS